MEEKIEYDWARIILAGIIILLLIVIIATVILFKHYPKVSNTICSSKMLESKDLTLLAILQEVNEKGYVDIGLPDNQKIRLKLVQEE